MSSSALSSDRPSPLERLRPVAAGHPVVRRWAAARRQTLPRDDRVTAVAGAWAHRTLLETRAEVESVLWCPGEADPAEWEALAADAVARADGAHRISPRTLARLQPGLTPPALLSLVRIPVWDPALVLTEQARLVLVADGIEYAGNLGTLVRTADACGADAVVLTAAVARVTHPKVFLASRGTVLTMPILEPGSVAAARWALAGFTTYVADPAGPTTYRDARLGSRPTAVVVGSEGRGVSAEWRNPDVDRVSIPMRGVADSLNVATSAAVLLFEARARLG